MTSRRRPPRDMRGRGVSYHMGRGSLLLPSSSLCRATRILRYRAVEPYYMYWYVHVFCGEATVDRYFLVRLFSGETVFWGEA
eukprot:COSAG01_NODE_3096_length_6591_cov_5.863986_7_plen_82_part_00